MKIEYKLKKIIFPTEQYNHLCSNTISKHKIKKETRNYFSGKLHLPSKLFPLQDFKNKKYRLIKLSYPCKLESLNQIGFGYLLFIENDGKNPIITKKIKSRDVWCKGNSFQREKKFQIHTRKSRGKTYHSLKIVMPKKSVKSNIFFIKIPDTIVISYYEKRDKFNSNKELQTKKGNCFLLFQPNSNAKIEVVTLNDNKSYVQLMKKGMNPIRIADTFQISENAVWKAVVEAYIHKRINIIDVMNLVFKFSRYHYVSDILEFLENERIFVDRRVKRRIFNLTKYSAKKDDLYKYFNQDIERKKDYDIHFNMNNLREIYKEKYKTLLNINQFECILLFYRTKLGLDIDESQNKEQYKKHKLMKLLSKLLKNNDSYNL